MHWFISGITIYLILCFLLVFMQRRILYMPHSLDRRYEFPEYAPGLTEVFLTCEDGIEINGLFAPGEADKPLMLMFHGNAGNITHREFLIQAFNQRGYPVLMIDYHGYGKSKGSPSEQNLYKDGRAALAWAREEKDYEPDRIVVFGKSLGSGIATELAANNTFKGLILETPFSSTVSVGRSHFPYYLFPVGLLLIDRYDNLSKIKDIECPLLLVHGTKDRLIPAHESAKLFSAAKDPKEYYVVQGAGHNNIQFVEPLTYWKTIQDWIGELP